MSPQEEIAESRIQEALAAGEFEDLPGRGERLNLESYFRTPEAWRMGMSVLRSAEIVPEEIELLREVEGLEARRAGTADAAERERIGTRISELMVCYELKMQRYRRSA